MSVLDCATRGCEGGMRAYCRASLRLRAAAGLLSNAMLMLIGDGAALAVRGAPAIVHVPLVCCCEH